MSDQNRTNRRVVTVMALFWVGFLAGIWYAKLPSAPYDPDSSAATDMQAEQLSGGR